MEYIRKDYEPKTKISDRSPVEFTDNATNVRKPLFKFRNY